MVTQRRCREQRRRRRAAEPAAGLVDDEHPVGVTVEGQAEVESTGDDPGAQVALVGGLQRVGRVVRERAVEFGVHDLELDAGETFEHGRHDEATHAVGGVGDHPHRADVGRIDEAARRDRRSRRAGRARTGDPQVAAGRGPIAVEHSFRNGLHLDQAGVDTDRAGTGEAQLDAVVAARGCATR